MKKILRIVGIVSCGLISTVFADYSLTQEDTTLVQDVIQKIQTKPIRTQEIVIKALKNAQNKTNFTIQKKAIFAAVESGLRQKTSSGELLATSLERREIVQSLFAQSNQGEKGSATILIAGDISSSEEGDMTIDGSLKTDVDVHNKENPKVRFQFDVKAKTEDFSLDTAGEMRTIGAAGYFFIKKLSIIPDEEQISGFIAPYLNKWWKIPLNQESTDTMETSPQSSFDTQQEKQILLNKNVIPELFYTGQNQGISMYRGTIDNEALTDMVYDLAIAQGERFTVADKIEMQEALSDVTLQTEFSLDTKKTFSGIMLTTSLQNKHIDTDSINGVITFTLTMSSQITPIVVPENARDTSDMFSPFE